MIKKSTSKSTSRLKKKDWDELANEIINLEIAITKEKKHKSLILLKKKLEVLEKEKLNRIFDTFDMQTFLNKNNENF